MDGQRAPKGLSVDIDRPKTSVAAALAKGNRSAWAHRAIVLAVAFLCWTGGQVQTRVATLPADVALDGLVYPVRVGPSVVVSADELAARVGTWPLGAPVDLVGSDGRVVTVEATERLYSAWHIWITRANGLFFLAVSLIVFASRTHVVPGRDLFWACLLYGLAVMIGGIHAPPARTDFEVALPILRIVSLVALPILLLHVGLTFPRRAAIFERAPWFFPSIVGLGVLLAAWQTFVWLRWFDPTSEGVWDTIVPTRAAAGIFLAAVFGGGCLGLVRGADHARSDREREQVKWVLVGIAMGAVPYVFLHALPQALDMPYVLPVAAARIFSVVIPITFSFAVIRHKFLDVDIIIRRSLLYLVLASLMVGVYSLLGIFAGNRVMDRWPQTAPFVPIVATLVSALLFNPTRRAIARGIDRVFFKIQFESTQALQAFRGDLASCTDQDALAGRFAVFVDAVLTPDRCVVVLLHDTRVFRAGAPLPAGSTAPVGKQAGPAIARVGATARATIESSSFPPVWAHEGYVLAHGIDAQGDELGYVVLGAKANERRYLAEELDLLADACREVAIRLKRLNLEQEIVDEIVARHRTEEMSRFRTDFFAQFAHDLRSPLTSISWSARNLLDGVVGPVSPDQTAYLDGIESSARQLVRLVNNLLEVTRLESGEPELELAPLSLRDVVEESVGKLRVTASAKQVTIDVAAGDEPSILGHREKLLEVVDNLLENAIRYSPPASSIDVRFAVRDEGVDLEIADRGPGLDPSDVEGIFEPYRQGSPSPYSNQHGFGLGLFVVRSWVERMGGAARGANREGGGAVFTIGLPRTTADEREAAS